MKILVVENNLAAFLTAVYHAYYGHKDAEKITSDAESVTMLDYGIRIETDTALAAKVREGIMKKAGKTAYKEIADAYLSGDKNKEQKLFDYLKLLFAQGKKALTLFSHSTVIAFRDMLNKVRREAHRMKGFIRFAQTENGVYYAFFGPDNDILELLLPHFRIRFNDQKFVLHDLKRKKMAYYDGDKSYTFTAPPRFTVALSEDQLKFAEQWREYFNNVSIEERHNPVLQRHYAPKKYRWFMNEF